jgi:NAD-dependent dihydropyrimidine dehydrogenase PreA subunit
MPAAFIPVLNYYNKFVSIKADSCIGCRLCIKICPKNDVFGIDEEGKKVFVLDSKECIACFKCLRSCPSGAIRPVFKRKVFAKE